MKKAIAAGIALAVVVLVTVVGWRAVASDDDQTARGTCDTGTYQLEVGKDDGALEVTFELQSAAVGEAWNVVVEQDGTPILNSDRQTDEDAELDIDVIAADDRGDEFSVTATRDDGVTCSASLTR
ncbi:MAG: hypothetical protein F2667_02540 [Actinobacteria bacterium]|uniref:Unannotated protein n=1 Tax=freshwater metagenome TaxID=449393 RepID=A0A6J6RC30_9ZZZZ|nr:hypothetical protein [Actinomycetota bacterium]